MSRLISTSGFNERIRENQADLLRYLERRLANPADAADTYGETLLTAWRMRSKMPTSPEDARLWLFTVARNVMLNSRRSLARRSAAIQRLADELVTATGPSDDANSDVREAIASLPPEDAELVRLVYWEGLASHEAARVVGLVPSTARSRLARARQVLRESLTAVLTL
jgi:RNA polymerase sigma-70 factor (ECF subfamily)